MIFLQPKNGNVSFIPYSGNRKEFHLQKGAKNDTHRTDPTVQYLRFLLDPPSGDPLVPG